VSRSKARASLALCVPQEYDRKTNLLPCQSITMKTPRRQVHARPKLAKSTSDLPDSGSGHGRGAGDSARTGPTCDGHTSERLPVEGNSCDSRRAHAAAAAAGARQNGDEPDLCGWMGKEGDQGAKG
jgi:hypothetical protein